MSDRLQRICVRSGREKEFTGTANQRGFAHIGFAHAIHEPGLNDKKIIQSFKYRELYKVNRIKGNEESGPVALSRENT